jgi:hypothetical protein
MFEINNSDRIDIINEIVKLLPSENIIEYKKNIEALTLLFEGQDANTLGVLYNAIEKGKFQDYYKKLKDYYESEGKNISVQERGFARNVNRIVLETILQKETEIANNERDPKDRKYWPRDVQMIAEHLGSVKMELFFLNCYKEIAGKK